METQILIDTHVFLWLNQDPERLLPEIRELISLPATKLFLSSASAFEITIKYHLKKLSLPMDPEKYVPARLRSNDILELPISINHTLVAGSLSVAHKDPFDRLLVAQSMIEKLPLLTANKKLSGFSCALMWAC